MPWCNCYYLLEHVNHPSLQQPGPQKHGWRAQVYFPLAPLQGPVYIVRDDSQDYPERPRMFSRTALWYSKIYDDEVEKDA
jgi:hypothetical protein